MTHLEKSCLGIFHTRMSSTSKERKKIRMKERKKERKKETKKEKKM